MLEYRAVERHDLTGALELCGAERVDVITDDAQGFCRSFAHKEWRELRIYPQLEKG